jgi:hypothetical protein
LTAKKIVLPFRIPALSSSSISPCAFTTTSQFSTSVRAFLLKYVIVNRREKGAMIVESKMARTMEEYSSFSISPFYTEYAAMTNANSPSAAMEHPTTKQSRR